MPRLLTSLLLFFLLELFSISFSSMALAEAPIEASAIDLLTWDFSAHNILLEDGWEFYWQELLEHDQPSKVLPVAMQGDLTWHKKIDPETGQKYGSFGYGTYRLRIKGLPFRGEGYEFLLRSAATTYKATVFPEGHPEAAIEMANGVVGRSRELTIPQASPKSLRFYPGSKEQVWIVMIQVANFHHNRGGLWHPPVLGFNLSREFANEEDGFVFSIGCILIIGIYNFMIFMRRIQERSALLLAIFCFAVAIRTFVTGDLISHYYPEPSLFTYHLKYALEYSTVIWAPMIFSLFTHYNFSGTKLPQLLKLGVYSSLLLTLFVLFSQVEVYTRWVLVFQGVALYFILVTLGRILMSILREKDGALTSLIGSGILTLTLIYDILVQNGLAIPPFISQYGVVAFVFLQSQVIAKRFSVAFSTAKYLKAKLQYEVELQTANIRSLMENVPIGIFMVNERLQIHDNYSKHMSQLIGRSEIAGLDVVTVLFENSSMNQEQIANIRSSLVSVLGESSIFWDLNSDHLPHEYRRLRSNTRIQIMEVGWHPILDARQNIDRILVTLRDVTHMRQLQSEARSKEQDLLKLVELLGVEPRGLKRFWKDVDAARDKIRAGGMPSLVRELHTLKGIARSLGLTKLTSELHDIEQGGVNSSSFQGTLILVEDLMKNYRSLYEKRLHSQSLSERDASIPLMILEELAKVSDHLRSERSSEPDELLRLVDELLCRSYYRSLADLCAELKVVVKDLAHSLGIHPPRLITTVPDLFLPELTERNLRSALLHIVRNSLSHGFKNNSGRAMTSRPEIHLKFTFDETTEALILTAEDNGDGLDLVRIKEQAERLNLTPDEGVSPLAIASMIFAPGLSTAQTLNEISGRGIGMDAVRIAFGELGGSVTIELVGRTDNSKPRFRVVATIPPQAFVLSFNMH